MPNLKSLDELHAFVKGRAAEAPVYLFASSAEFVGTDLRRIYASDSLLGIKLRSIGPKFWVSKNLLGC
ncbi:MAG: hypothetical protein ACREYE_25715, partial [Gammaproteobacteria bacterium]